MGGALARGLAAILVLEIGCYLLLAPRMAQAQGAAMAAATILAIALAVRSVPILLSYAIAWRHASPVPPSQRIGLHARLLAMAREIGVTVLLYTWLQPFARVSMRSDPAGPGRDDRPPVLLVHGYLCNRAVWWSLRRWLESLGYAVFTLNQEPVFGSIDVHAGQLARRIDEIRRATGAPRVLLIGHSVGGLVARAYLRDHGGSAIAQVFTLGSPHHGSMHAWLAPGENGRQMRPGCTWLARLAAAEQSGLAAPFTSIYSCHDNFIAPQDSSRLPGAQNVALAGVGHLSLAFSPIVRAALAQRLR